MSQAMDRLTAAVTKNAEVDASVIVLLRGLAQQIRDLKTDPVALEALAVELETKNQVLADAVVEHTPAA